MSKREFVNFLRQTIQRLRGARRSSVAYYISFWVFGTALLSLGPMLQTYSLAIINSTESSIYASVYKNAVIAFPGLGEWLGGMAYGVFSICSAVVMAYSLRACTFRGAFIRGLMSSAAALIVLDVIADIHSGSISFSGVLTNIACNMVGGVIVAAILVLALRATKAISVATDDHVLMQRMMAVAFPPVLGFLLLVMSFYIAGLFFKLVPANVDVVVQPDSRGAVKFEQLRDLESNSNCSAECEGKRKKDKSFGFLVGSGQVEELATLEHGEGPLYVLWAAGKDHSVYNVSISAVSGCFGVGHEKIKLDESKRYTISNAKKMSLELDEGLGVLSLVSSSPHLEVVESPGTNFLVSKSNAEAKTLKLSRWLASPSSFDYWSASQSYKIVVSAELSKAGERSQITPMSRSIKIKVDGEEYKLALNSSSLGTLDKKPPCSVLDVSNLGRSKVSLLSNLVLNAGVVVDIERQFVDDKIFYMKGSALTVRGGAGWLVVDKIQPSSAQRFVQAGTIGGIGFGGDVKSFQLNGVAVPTNETDWFAITSAQLIGRMDRDGNMLYSGVGQNIWKGNSRLNRTRWENIDASTQLLLLSLLGIGVATLFGFFIGSMKGNEKLELL